MKIIQSYLTLNPCYEANVNKINSKYVDFQKNGPKGLMLHSVGCAQPTATVFTKSWNKTNYTNACVHAFIDANSGDVYQCLPWNFRGWHGGGNSNNTHIGVEMCEPNCIKYVGGSAFTITYSNLPKAQEMATRTYNVAVELFASICTEYKLNPLKDGVIISHKEGYSRGIATNHGDPEHLWTQLHLPYTMDTFRTAVAKKMGLSVPTTSNPVKSTEVPFLVRIKVDALNVRKGAGTNYPITTVIRDRGIYTIIEVNGRWGRLKSKVGWIHLDYTERYK